MDVLKLQRFTHRLYKSHIPFLPGLIQIYIHFRYNCDLPPVIKIGKGSRLGHRGIGVVINSKAIIGRNVIIAQNVTVAGRDGKAPVIEDWCYLGANSVVLGGVKLGKDSYVGALTFVNKDVPDGAVVAGIPAKVLRIRTQEEIEEWHKWVIKQGGVPFNEGQK